MNCDFRDLMAPKTEITNLTSGALFFAQNSTLNNFRSIHLIKDFFIMKERSHPALSKKSIIGIIKFD